VAERVRCLRNMGKADKYAYSSGLSGLSDIGLPHVERGTPPAWHLSVVRRAAQGLTLPLSHEHTLDEAQTRGCRAPRPELRCGPARLRVDSWTRF